MLLLSIIRACLLTIAAATSLSAQTQPPVKTFDIISIRQNKTPGQPQMQFGPTANGYEARSLPLLATILRAYVPLTNTQGYYTMDRIKGAPDWLTSDRYDVIAKVSDTDLPAWQQTDAQTKLLPEMLQAALADRCKLQVHRESKDATVFNLVLAKGGLKLTESAPDAPKKGGITLPAGGTLIPGPGGRSLAFYAATMASLAQVLSNFVGYPVVDKTGLTGHYDFVLERDEPQENGPPNPGPPTYAVDALGLHLDKSRNTVDTLVIDHIEKPTEN